MRAGRLIVFLQSLLHHMNSRSIEICGMTIIGTAVSILAILL